jgi:hypothetical protein
MEGARTTVAETEVGWTYKGRTPRCSVSGGEAILQPFNVEKQNNKLTYVVIVMPAIPAETSCVCVCVCVCAVSSTVRLYL